MKANDSYDQFAALLGLLALVALAVVVVVGAGQEHARKLYAQNAALAARVAKLEAEQLVGQRRLAEAAPSIEDGYPVTLWISGRAAR